MSTFMSRVVRKLRATLPFVKRGPQPSRCTDKNCRLSVCDHG